MPNTVSPSIALPGVVPRAQPRHAHTDQPTPSVTTNSATSSSQAANRPRRRAGDQPTAGAPSASR
ncbi:hypothetical protein [Pseudonocardia acaciae]|uniref:hypothetical protein n=1 Tax=Pseudonocardia acaciae TaxID=551276 RepID=UPI001FE23D9B|nr:hypothetical protein [Pseudonocardia acaciae]